LLCLAGSGRGETLDLGNPHFTSEQKLNLWGFLTPAEDACRTLEQIKFSDIETARSHAADPLIRIIATTNFM